MELNNVLVYDLCSAYSVGYAMTQQIQELADQAKKSVPKGILAPDLWIKEYNRILGELIAEECASMCMSQADRRNIRRAFGIPVESDVKYKGPDADGSITSQYTRPYNLPNGVTNKNP